MSEKTRDDREARKQKLRRQVVDSAASKEKEEKKQADRALLKRRILIGAAGLVLAIGVFFLWRFLDSRAEYTAWEVVWEDGTATSDAQFSTFNSNLLRYSADGVTLLKDLDEVLWTGDLSMNEPVLSVAGKYGLIADRGGQNAVIFDETGILADFSTTLPIVASALSEHGVACFMLQDADYSLIHFYDRSGSRLDIEVKNVLAADEGYPLGMALSPEGTGLVLSLVTVMDGEVGTHISFLNFDSGKDNYDRLVGVFRYENSVYPQVEYLSADRVCAFGNGRLDFFDLGNEAAPKLLRSETPGEQMQSVFAGCGYAGVIFRKEEAEGYIARVYNADGEELYSASFDFDYTRAEFSEGSLLVYNSSKCILVAENGVVRFSGEFSGATDKIIRIGSRNLLQFGDYGIREVKLK